MLHVAVKLLSYEPRCVPDNAFANALLSRFVTQATTLYSHFFMSYNIHALFHLSSDVLRFGPMDNFSAYRFENYYGKMKRHIKKNDKPLQQLFKRLLETAQNQNAVGQNPADQIEFINSHSSNPIVENIFGIQFRSVKLPGIGHLRADDEADNCVFLKDTSVVVIADFVKCSNRGVVVGKNMKVKEMPILILVNHL